MKLQPAVKKESLRMACGIGILTVLMLVVYVAIGRFHYTVLLGALLGTATASLNFFLMAMSVQKAADKMDGVALPPEEEPAEGEEPNKKNKKREYCPEALSAKRSMQASYTLRMLMQGVMAIIAVVAPCFNAVAAMLPLLFPRIVITMIGLTQNKKKEG